MGRMIQFNPCIGSDMIHRLVGRIESSHRAYVEVRETGIMSCLLRGRWREGLMTHCSQSRMFKAHSKHYGPLLFTDEALHFELKRKRLSQLNI